MKGLEAAWKVSQSLRERPELISHMIASSILNLQMGVMRKMEESIPVQWQGLLAVRTWQDPYLRAMELDALVMSRYVADPTDMMVGRWFHPFYGPLGTPVRRLAQLESTGRSPRKLCLRSEPAICAETIQRENSDGNVKNSHSSWNLGTRFGGTNYLRAWKPKMQTLAEMELTAKVLQVSRLRDTMRGIANGRTVWGRWSRRSVRRPDGFMRIAPDGRIQIYCRNLPEWLKKEHPTSTPLKYSLKAAGMRSGNQL